MKLSIEIRSGEGGEDAKLLVNDQARIYLKYAEQTKINVEIVNSSHG